MTIMFVYLPKLGMAMEEGTIVEWLVADGELVQEGRPLYVVDNDKVETQIDSPYAGTVRILVPPGASCAVGTPIAEIDVPNCEAYRRSFALLTPHDPSAKNS